MQLHWHHFCFSSRGTRDDNSKQQGSCYAVPNKHLHASPKSLAQVNRSLTNPLMLFPLNGWWHCLSPFSLAVQLKHSQSDPSQLPLPGGQYRICPTLRTGKDCWFPSFLPLEQSFFKLPCLPILITQKDQQFHLHTTGIQPALLFQSYQKDFSMLIRTKKIPARPASPFAQKRTSARPAFHYLHQETTPPGPAVPFTPKRT